MALLPVNRLSLCQLVWNAVQMTCPIEFNPLFQPHVIWRNIAGSICFWFWNASQVFQKYTYPLVIGSCQQFFQMPAGFEVRDLHELPDIDDDGYKCLIMQKSSIDLIWCNNQASSLVLIWYFFGHIILFFWQWVRRRRESNRKYKFQSTFDIILVGKNPSYFIIMLEIHIKSSSKWQ